MEVQAVIEFTDREADKPRVKDEKFTVGEKRAEKLINLGYVKAVPEKKKVEKG